MWWLEDAHHKMRLAKTFGYAWTRLAKKHMLCKKKKKSGERKKTKERKAGDHKHSVHFYCLFLLSLCI